MNPQITEKQEILFFYPSTILGGAEILFKNTVEALVRDGFNAFVVDTEGSWLSKNVAPNLVRIISNKKKYNLTGNSILVTPPTLVDAIGTYFSGSGRLAVWMLHPHNLTIGASRFSSLKDAPFWRALVTHTVLRPRYIKLLNLVRYLSSTNALYPMDGSCIDEIKNEYHETLRAIIPIFLPNHKINLVWTPHSRKKKKAIWLGRLDGSFKTPILSRVIHDLDDFCSFGNNELEIYVIGNGPGANKIQAIKSKLNKVNIIMIGELENDKLTSWIANADIGFAMGTSALELAARGLPTVLLDFSYSRIPKNYKYRWIFEAVKGDLGHNIATSDIAKTLSSENLKSIMNKLKDDENIISSLCFDHVKLNHSESAAITALRRAFMETGAHTDNLRKL